MVDVPSLKLPPWVRISDVIKLFREKIDEAFWALHAKIQSIELALNMCRAQGQAAHLLPWL